MGAFQRWESGNKVEIPEFNGGIEVDDFLDWLCAVEEVLEYKEVPDDKRVSLVATRLRGRAAAWWQQLKQNRECHGKPKIKSWDRMKKHLKVAFLPFNYTRTLYQRLQNLRHVNRSVTEYTTDFYQLIARNDLGKSEDQLVARYIGGLRLNLQDTLNMFSPVSVSEAHQHALQSEIQLQRRTIGGSSGPSRGGGRFTTPNPTLVLPPP